jgi:hypothetical protein
MGTEILAFKYVITVLLKMAKFLKAINVYWNLGTACLPSFMRIGHMA